MSESSVIAAFRNAISATFPAMQDWSDNPNPPRADKLSAFWLDMERVRSAPVAMGSLDEEVTLSVELSLVCPCARDDDIRSDAWRNIETAKRAVLDNADLAALVDFLHCDTADVDLARSENRLARGFLLFTVEATFAAE